MENIAYSSDEKNVDLFFRPASDVISWPDEIGLARRYSRAVLRTLYDEGFLVTFDRDLEQWARFVEASGNSVNPTFDPRSSEIDPETCFWMKVTRRSGEPVACIADQVIESDDYVALMADGRLWFRDPDPAEMARAAFVLKPPGRIGGRIGHHGGLVVLPAWRARGLAGLLTRLARALSIERWQVDWHCGVTFAHLAERDYPRRIYGYADMHLCFDGYFPPIGADARIYMTTIDKAQMLEQMRQELRAGELDGDQQPVDRRVAPGQR